MTASAVVAFGAVSALGEGLSALGNVPIGHPAPFAIARDPELAASGLARPFCARTNIVPDADLPRAWDAPDRATVILSHALDACVRELDAVMPDFRELRVGLALGTSSGGMRRFEEIFADAARPQEPDRFQVDASSRRSARGGPEQPASALRTAPEPPTMKSHQIESGPKEGWIEGTYLGPVLAVRRPCAFVRSALVLGACASSTLAIGLGRAWLEANACDVVLVGGFDAVSVFVAAGFEVLRATSADGKPDPFRVGRDGLTLGEGAAVLALACADRARERQLRTYGWVTGFGASCDAFHLTAPDRTGGGLVRAATAAMRDAGSTAGDIDLVSAHGTATEFNDASEACALATLLGEHRSRVVVHALKGSMGHTLGAAGALESLSALRAMYMETAPASAGEGMALDGVRVLGVAEACPAAVTLKLSSAFGGANAALVLAKDAPNTRPKASLRSVYVSRAVAVLRDAVHLEPSVLAARTGYAEDRILRSDGLVRLALAAVTSLDERLASNGQVRVKGAGIIVGHGLATMDTNVVFQERIRALGAHRAEPRRFPYTTPNAAAGECAVVFGLTGPAFAVGGGPHGGLEALGVAADLVRTGTADRIVVVAADEAGAGSRRVAPHTACGAVALLVAASPLAGELVECGVRLEKNESRPRGTSAMDAHRALLPLVTAYEPSENGVAATPPRELSVRTPWGANAYARFLWL